ncbi:MAG: hypothetical protein JO360_03110 [Acidobacteria bacterium]|nr:hypothetical protein [Acidobacteriota bacterium]
MMLTLLFVLCCAPLAAAQNEDQPEFKMPCAQVLKLGLNEFMDVYGEKTADYSTLGMKQGFSYYADCKRPANDELAQHLSPERRKQADAVRDELQKMGNAAWDLAYISAGGGTMYALLKVGAYATREDSMTKLITALGNERAQPAARRRVAASLAKARRLLVHWAHMPKIEVYGEESLAEMQQQYRDEVKEAQAAFDRLQALIRVLPDAAAELVAKQAAEELDAKIDS